MKHPTFRFFLLCFLLVCLVVFKFHGPREAQARDSGGLYAHTLTGNIQLVKAFRSKFLPTPRELIVYLPPNYEQETGRRYPVLYMQDGQIIFDAATSFFAGRERHLDERAQTLIEQQKIEPLIIVGIYSSGLARKQEFTPPTETHAGNADLYGEMLVEEVKPFIEQQYRTLNDREHTALGGSSLGGLVTMYLGLKYSNIFGRLAVTSPAAFTDNEMIVRYVRALRTKTNQRICLSAGAEEAPLFLNSIRDLNQALLDKGWKEGVDLSYMEANGSEHSPDERSLRVDHLLTNLFPVSAPEK
jgi:predicted alpha/beta superfamily hydrolase